MYISVKEAAEKWGVSNRQVQRLLANGRIPRAQKFGRSWQIPESAEKPSDFRHGRNSSQESLSAELDELITAINTPVTADSPNMIFRGVNKDRMMLIHEGALAYARGDFDQTIRSYRQSEGDDAAQLCASSLAISAAISVGDYPFHLEIESFLKNIARRYENTSIAAYAELALSGAYLGALAPDMIPGWLKKGEFSKVHPLARPDAAYKRAKYFQCVKDYSSMLAVGQTALEFCGVKQEISFPATYLTLLCAAACQALDRKEEAEIYLIDVMDKNLPNGFITPFVEYLAPFGGMIKKLLEHKYPEYLDDILMQWESTFRNWLEFHNQFTKDNVTTILSLRDYQIAKLAARGVPYSQIAKEFHISNGRLKNLMQEICEKLYISGRNRREELARFIL